VRSGSTAPDGNPSAHPRAGKEKRGRFTQTYEPAASPADLKPAAQTLHMSPEAPSAIILPVVK